MGMICFLCMFLLIACQAIAMRFSPGGRLPRWPMHSRRHGVRPRFQDSSEEPSVSWIKVENVPDVQASDGADVLPIFPMNDVRWLGPDDADVVLNIVDPGYRRMYDDILLDGSRRFLMPWSPCVSTFPRGRVRFAEIPEEDRRLHAVGVILYLEDLTEVSDQTQGAIKYVCKHKVMGRARMTRLLNPSALFRTNEKGFKEDYLKAEVEFYDDILDRTDATLTSNSAEKLEELWLDLANETAKMDFSRPKKMVLQNMARRGMTWDLSYFWQQWMLAIQLDRERSRVADEVESYLKDLQSNGKIKEIPRNIDIARLLPQDMLVRYVRAQTDAGLQLSADYWQPLLRLQAAEGPKDRSELLIEAAAAELRLMKTRVSLRNLLG